MLYGTQQTKPQYKKLKQCKTKQSNFLKTLTVAIPEQVQIILHRLLAGGLNVVQAKPATKSIEQTECRVREGLSRRYGMPFDQFVKQYGKLGATAVWCKVVLGVW